MANIVRLLKTAQGALDRARNDAGMNSLECYEKIEAAIDSIEEAIQCWMRKKQQNKEVRVRNGRSEWR